MTPKPHPKVITIQPEFWALDLLRSTAATTPSPSKIRRHVPIVSAPMMLKSFSLLDRTWGRRRHYPRAFDNVKPSSPNRNPVRHRSLGSRRSVPRNIQSIERAAAILRLLSGRARRMGVVDIAGELGLSKGTVHGLLRTLQHVGFVEQDSDSGKYQLGAALLHMGSSYLDGNELRTRALNWSDSLAARTNESVRIGTLHEGQVLIVHHVFRPDDSLQTLDVGSLLPAHATALGKVLLAHQPYTAGELAKAGLAAFTDATIAARSSWARWASPGRPSACSPRASRGTTWLPTCARPHAPCPASSGRSPGRQRGGDEGALRCGDRSGHSIVALPDLRPVGAHRVGRPEGAPAVLPAPRVGRARRGGD